MDGEEPPLIERLAAADVNYLQQVAQSYLEAAAADKIAAVTAALRTQVESGRRSYLTPFRYAQTLADARNRLNEMRESRRDVVYEVASLLTALDVTDPNQVEALTPALRGVVLNLRDRDIASLTASIDNTERLPGETDVRFVSRVADQWSFNPPTFQTEAISRGLTLALASGLADQRGVRRVNTPLPGLPCPVGYLPSRPRAYKVALPANPDDFGKELAEIATFTDLDVAALESGTVPTPTLVTRMIPSRSTDGGPSATADAQTRVLVAAGKDVQQETNTLIRAALGDAVTPGPDGSYNRPLQELTDARTDALDEHLAAEALINKLQADRALDLERIAVENGFTGWYDVIDSLTDVNESSRVRELARTLIRDNDGTGDTDLFEARLDSAEAKLRYKTLGEQLEALGVQIGEARRAAYLDVLSRLRDYGNGTPIVYTVGGRTTTMTDILRGRIGRPRFEDDPLVQAMRFAEASYPTDWLNRLAAEWPTYSLDESPRGGHTAGQPIMTLSSHRTEHLAGGTEFGYVAVHELGHGMENRLPGLRAAQEAYLWSRTSTGEIGDREREQQVGTGTGSGNEYGYADEFVHPYTGRAYPVVWTGGTATRC
ncbi:MAG: hypothetical protein ACR2HA_06935 [Nocardioides sp.]